MELPSSLENEAPDGPLRSPGSSSMRVEKVYCMYLCIKLSVVGNRRREERTIDSIPYRHTDRSCICLVFNVPLPV